MRSILTDRKVADYVGDRLGTHFADPYVAMGIERDGRIIGGVVFNGYNGRNVDISGCGEAGFLTIAFLRRLSRYVVVELGCSRVSFITANGKAAALVRRLGGVHEGTAFDWFGDGEHGQRFGISAKNWKFR